MRRSHVIVLHNQLAHSAWQDVFDSSLRRLRVVYVYSERFKLDASSFLWSVNKPWARPWLTALSTLRPTFFIFVLTAFFYSNNSPYRIRKGFLLNLETGIWSLRSEIL